MHNSNPQWLTSIQALQKLQEMGATTSIGKKDDSPLSYKQFHNWIGSGKLCFEIINGQKKFSPAHNEVLGHPGLPTNHIQKDKKYLRNCLR